MATALPEAPSDSARRIGRRPVAPSRGLTVQVSVGEDDRVTVHAAGKLDIYTVPRLRMKMSRYDPASGMVVLDVSGVTLIDSAGLGTLLSFANQARRAGVRLGLVCSPELHQVLQIARLDDAFAITFV